MKRVLLACKLEELPKLVKLQSESHNSIYNLMALFQKNQYLNIFHFILSIYNFLGYIVVDAQLFGRTF